MSFFYLIKLNYDCIIARVGTYRKSESDEDNTKANACVILFGREKKKSRKIHSEKK